MSLKIQFKYFNFKGESNIMKKFRELTNEDLVVMYQTGFGFDKADALEELLKRMEGIMTKFVNAYSNIPNVDEVDKMSELQIAFVKIVDNFNIAKGYKLTTYCKAGFKRVLDKMYRDNTRQIRFDKDVIHTSYEVMVETKQDGEDECSCGDAKTDTYDKVEYIDMIENTGFNEKEKAVAYLISAGKNKATVAKMLGISATMVNCHLANIKKKLTNAGCI